MIKVLMTGLTDIVGGVDIYIRNIVANIDQSDIHFDFLGQGIEKAALEDELYELCGGQCRFYYAPAFKEHPNDCITFLDKLYQNEYDIVYVNASLATDVLYAWPYVEFHKKTKMIIHSHNSSLYGKEKQHQLFKWCTCRANLKLACSEKAARWMFGSMNRVKLIHNGIDTERFQYSEKSRKEIRDRYGIGEKEYVIGNVGRLCYQKNQVFLFDVLKRLREQGISTYLMLVGEGEDELDLRVQARQKGVVDWVFFCGVQKKIEKFYSAFDVFAMPSWYEGLPLAGVEAQAAGLHCLFSDRIDRQILLTDHAHMLVLEEEKDSWNEVISWILQRDLNEREQYSSEICEKGYDIRTTAKRIRKIIDQLIYL